MSENLIEKIKKEIEKTGFPLELRISDILYKNGYYVANSLYYVDEDEKKSREVDLRAIKNYEINELKGKSKTARIRHCFFIECKKNIGKHWIFLCSPKTVYDIGCDKVPSLPTENIIKDVDLSILKRKHPFANFSFVGRSYFEAFANSNQNNIFKAITTVVKSTLYYMDKKFAISRADTCFYYPLVILEGRLFGGILNNNKIEVKEVNSILLSFLYESKNRRNSSFSIPIITEKEVKNFFKKMDDVLNFLGKSAKDNPKRFFPHLEI